MSERPTPTDQPQRIVCTRCGTAFGCDPAGDCWCRDEEVRLPMPVAGASCLCPDCLRAAAAAGQARAL